MGGFFHLAEAHSSRLQILAGIKTPRKQSRLPTVQESPTSDSSMMSVVSRSSILNLDNTGGAVSPFPFIDDSSVKSTPSPAPSVQMDEALHVQKLLMETQVLRARLRDLEEARATDLASLESVKTAFNRGNDGLFLPDGTNLKIGKHRLNDGTFGTPENNSATRDHEI